MTSTQVLHRIGVLTVATLLATGISLNPLHAQDSAKPGASAENVKKKKETEKKEPKQADTTQKSSGAAPMSGFRPDPQTNY